jgi:hypothetical protein
MARDPAVVGKPAMSMRSFTATRGPEPGWESAQIQVATPARLAGDTMGS